MSLKNQCIKEHNNLHFQGRLNKIFSSLLKSFISLLIVCVLLSPAGRKPGKLDPRDRVVLQNKRQGIPGDNRADRGEEGELFLMDGHSTALCSGVSQREAGMSIHPRMQRHFPLACPGDFPKCHSLGYYCSILQH